MTEKLKKKIEAMAEKYQKYHKLKPQYDAHKEGAKPFAEWCERLALTMSYITDEANGKAECHNMARVALADYEKWLEQTGD